MGKGGSTPSYQEPDPVPASSPPAASDNADVQRVKQEQKAKLVRMSGEVQQLFRRGTAGRRVTSAANPD